MLELIEVHCQLISLIVILYLLGIKYKTHEIHLVFKNKRTLFLSNGAGVEPERSAS
jgi:hypothetical protein